MTLKEMMKKVEAYNEIAAIAGTDKLELIFKDGLCVHTGFTTWEELRKWIRAEYIKPFADTVMKANKFEFDKEHGIAWEDYNQTGFAIIETYLTRV